VRVRGHHARAVRRGVQPRHRKVPVPLLHHLLGKLLRVVEVGCGRLTRHSKSIRHHASAVNAAPKASSTPHDSSTADTSGLVDASGGAYASSAPACGVTRLTVFIASGISSGGKSDPLIPPSTSTSSVPYTATCVSVRATLATRIDSPTAANDVQATS